MVGLMRHRQTKGPVSARLYLNRRATPRLHLTILVWQVWVLAESRSLDVEKRGLLCLQFLACLSSLVLLAFVSDVLQQSISHPFWCVCTAMGPKGDPIDPGWEFPLIYNEANQMFSRHGVSPLQVSGVG